MPESLIGSSSSATSGSNRSKAFKYRTKAISSEVDESLFGVKQPKDECSVEVQFQDPATRKVASAPSRYKPETIRLITNDLIRDLVVPSEDPSGTSLIMTPSEFSRIKSASRVLSKHEREAVEQAKRSAKESIMDAVNERKNTMKQKEMLRKKNEKLSELEEEAQRRAQYLLERANTIRMEQEDEIKKLKEMTLNAKCHAIRDAQILEKSLIEKEVDTEEKRLDQMMEVERQKAIKIQEDIDRKRKQEMIRGKMHIINQMGENEELRILQEEQRDQEAQQMLHYLEELQMNDFKDMERKRLEQLEIQEEVKRINAENIKKKEGRLEQEKLADLRVVEYNKQKMAREAEYEAEQAKIRKEKEKEVARLRALQEKSQDHQAAQDALRAKRNQEAAERAWRQKEKEEALKKAETEAIMKHARQEQVAQREHYAAMQAHRDRVEFERVLRIQQDLINKERKEIEEKSTKLMKHASELRKQVRESEQKHANERIAFFEEGKRLDEEARQRRTRLDELKKKKLDELRLAGLPEKYCAMVARKAEIPTAMVH
ncbi:cilia- and flagella-associated protein 45 [Ambystoma mexicanum]|uniref:cilia- and flagella-associated protein 45 n=1 Tax=Ambystoma mexicanum TaxID=8296 RepID=UPI0037E79F75